MAAQIRILQPDEADKGFGLLKDIIEMVKNPQAIEDAYEARRKGAQLTDDEVAKAAAARALIAQADAIREELKQKDSALQAKEIAHGGNVSVHQQNVEKDHKRFNEWEQRLTEKQKKQEETDVRHTQERKDLDKHSKEIEDSHAQWLLAHESDKQEIENDRIDNRLENDRLEKLAAKLKAKAARLAAEAESDS